MESPRIAPCDLTPEQRQKWNDTLSMMSWVAPGFRHIWYKLLTEANKNGKSDYFAVMSKDVPIAATDGKNVVINPESFFKLGLAQRTFVAAHEIVHNIFDDVNLLHRCNKSGKVPMHDGSFLPFDNANMQEAMDLRINDLLINSKIGKMPDVGCHDQTMGKADESVLDIYKKVYTRDHPDGEDGGGQPGPGKGGFDKLLPPGSSTGQNAQEAASERNPGQWAVEVSAAQTLEQMRAQGKMAGALQRMFQQILEPEVPWTEHIRSELARKVGSGAYNWRRGDRRFISRDIFLPSQSGYGAGWIVVWGDTSGSRSDSEIASNMAELAGIIDDVRPKRITVIWCDAEPSHIDEVEDAMDLQRIMARGVGGGGGTSVDPVFKWIEDNAHEPPDMFIGFTDGYVTFPKNAPSYPVIWASSTDYTYPWGEVVRVNKRAQA